MTLSKFTHDLNGVKNITINCDAPGCGRLQRADARGYSEAIAQFAREAWYVVPDETSVGHLCKDCGPRWDGAVLIQPPGGARGGQAVDLSTLIRGRGPSNPGAQFQHDPPLAKGAHDPRLAGIVVSAGSGGVDPVDIDVDVTIPMDGSDGSIRVYRRGKVGRTDLIGPITVPDDAKQDLRDKLDRAKDAFRLTLTLGDEECMTSPD